MRTLSLALALSLSALVLVVAQGDPANPFPNHEEPPKNWFCRPAKDAEAIATDAHACACLGMKDDPMCGETPMDTEQLQENAKCKTWCHRDSCACVAHCNPDSN